MNDYEHLKRTDRGAVATVTLARPESHNALNAKLIEELTRCFEGLADDERVRVVVLEGEGHSFCAGADVGYMRDTAGFSYEENLEDARRLAEMFWVLDESPKPVVARVRGAAIGGGAGLVAVADVVVAEEGTRFAFSEVRLGIAPATIAPFVVRKVGVSHARSLFLTGERFGAQRAREISLVHEVASEADLDAAVEEKVEGLLRGGPMAQATVKGLLPRLETTEPMEQPGLTARVISELRTGEEGQEGLAAFLEKREPPLAARPVSFGKLLVANRGEIAVRVIRACRELGTESVAVYSEADEGAMHRRLADEAYLLGPAPAPESYLNVGRLAEAIERSGTDAVHPGYGFLSESAAFARAVEAAGAVWVGPSPEAMEAVGLKVRAKELARRAGVPTVPGYDGEDQSEERLGQEAARLGYPVLVKASAGGGGRGMRAVADPGGFVEAVRSARREAEAAFGDGSVFLEKLVEDPRHVEVQVIGDSRGDVVHLYERECSIQRRHQKVVEEAPSPALDPDLREAICDAAVRFAREAGYGNAGTVEFLLDGEEFYFLEMNARLQVEHPVTELVTGLDLVHLQLAVAAGEPLPLGQEDVTLRGSAIEARLYAEDERGMPSGGRLEGFSLPEGAGVRNDAGFEAGDPVPIQYDSMLAKLIIHAPDRTSAVRRLRRALSDYAVLGVPTNLPLLRRIAAHPAFDAGRTTTRFLEEHGLTEPPSPPPLPREALLLAAAAELYHTPASTDPFAAGPWRLLGAARLLYLSGEREHLVEAERPARGALRITAGGEESTVEVLHAADDRVRASVDGEPVEAGVLRGDAELLVSLGGATHALRKASPPTVDEAGPAADAAASLTAPMPGTVVKVLVEEGEEVEEGQLLLILEAMKMEQPVSTPHAGVVRSLPFGEGSLVPGGAVLAEVEPG